MCSRTARYVFDEMAIHNACVLLCRKKKLSQDLQSHSLKILMTKRAAIGQDYHDRVRSPDTKDESGPSEAISD